MGDGHMHRGCVGPNDCKGIQVAVGGLECPLNWPEFTMGRNVMTG